MSKKLILTTIIVAIAMFAFATDEIIVHLSPGSDHVSKIVVELYDGTQNIWFHEETNGQDGYDAGDHETFTPPYYLYLNADMIKVHGYGGIGHSVATASPNYFYDVHVTLSHDDGQEPPPSPGTPNDPH